MDNIQIKELHHAKIVLQENMHQILAQIVVKIALLDLILLKKLLHVLLAQLELFQKAEPLLARYA
jgi:hypothetical protein